MQKLLRYIVALAFIVPLAGCVPEKTITVTRMPKIYDEMQVGILADKQKFWVFKLVGRQEKVQSNSEAFMGFLKSFQPSSEDSESGEPDWVIPSSWNKVPNSSGFTYATFETDDGSKVTVSDMKTMGDLDEFVLININRWLGQMGNDPVSPAALGTVLKKVDGAKTEIQFFSSVGRFNPGGMGAPGMGSGVPPFAGKAAGGSAPNSSPDSSSSSSKTEPESAVEFEKPADWQKIKNKMFALHTFRIDSDGKTATVSVSEMTLQNTWRSNADRWYGSMKQSIPTDEELEKATALYPVGDVEGNTLTLEQPEGDKRQAMVGVMAKTDKAAWFIKLIGDHEIVMNRKAEFLAFLKSFKFK